MKKGNITLLAQRSKHSHLFGEEVLDGAAILSSYLKTVFKLDDTAISSILKHGKIAKAGETLSEVATAESILATITALDAGRVLTIKNTSKDDLLAQGYNKAKGEIMTASETAKKARFGITSDLTGEALDDFIIDQKLKEAGATGEEAIKKTPTYQQLEARMKDELKKLREAGEAKVKELETNYKKEGTFTKVGQSAIDILTGLNPILPKTAAVAETAKKDFLNELKGYEYDLHEDGKVVVSKDGKVLEDGHGNTLAYEDHVKKIAGNRFEFAVNNDNENSGDKNKSDVKKPAAYPTGINKPKNITELTALTRAESKLKPEEKRVVIDEYRARTAAN